jgi:hypothetical protein
MTVKVHGAPSVIESEELTGPCWRGRERKLYSEAVANEAVANRLKLAVNLLSPEFYI